VVGLAAKWQGCHGVVASWLPWRYHTASGALPEMIVGRAKLVQRRRSKWQEFLFQKAHKASARAQPLLVTENLLTIAFTQISRLKSNKRAGPCRQQEITTAKQELGSALIEHYS
jgi:hypothetical protein